MKPPTETMVPMIASGAAQGVSLVEAVEITGLGGDEITWATEEELSAHRTQPGRSEFIA